MFFDDLEKIKTTDPTNVIGQIRSIPEQILSGWQLGLSKQLPELNEIKHILFIGVGESANSAELVKAYIEPECSIPVSIIRNYELPKWANGNDIMVIAISHTGNTVETISALKNAYDNQCQILSICTGGKILNFSEQYNLPKIVYYHDGHRGFAIGYVFGIALAILFQAGYINDQTDQLMDLVVSLKKIIEFNDLTRKSPHNPAKRLAGQIMNRSVLIIGADFLGPVAKRWKNQINTTAKAWAQYDIIPELNHNTQECIYFPEAVVRQLMVIFLRSELLNAENFLRVEKTKESFMLAGVGTDLVEARGQDRLTHIWSTILMGDLVAYYLAIAYQVDPASIENIEDFISHLRK